MGDKSPPVCPGYALRSTVNAMLKMPQTPSPADPPTAQQVRYKQVDRKVSNPHSFYNVFFFFFLIFVAFYQQFYQNQL